MQPSTPAKRAWLLLFIAIAAFYLWGLGSLPLVGPDEPRYAQVAREMFTRSDFITPTLGGFPWFEKPPLLYWMMTVSYRLLGVTEYAVRLGPAISGLLTGVFVYLLGSAIEERRPDTASESLHLGRWCALVWLSSLGPIGFSRGATFDIVLTMTISGALASWFMGEVKTGKNLPSAALLFGFYFFTGLSLLAKGLIGPVLIFGVIGFYFVLRREWPRRQFLISLVWGLPFSMAVAAGWYVPMIARHGWLFIDQFIIQHHFARFATNKYHHPGPIYYYLPVLIGLALPWTIVLGASLLSSRRWNWRGVAPLDRARVLGLAWLVVPIVFFSFSGSKLVAYILPALPAVAVLAGERLACFWKEQRGAKVLRLTGALLIVIAVAAVWYTHQQAKVSLLIIILDALTLVVAGALALIRPHRSLFVVIVVVTFLTAKAGLISVGPALARSQSVRDLLTDAAARGYSASPVVQLHTIERSAEFYAAGRIAYGDDGEPVKFEGVAQVFDVARRNGGTVLCLIPSKFASQLMAVKEAKSELISDNGRVALILVRVN